MGKLNETGLSKEFLQHFQTEVDLEVIYFYLSNPFSIFTARSLALALGRKKELVQESLIKLEKAGFLRAVPQSKQLEAIYYYQPGSKSEKLIQKLFSYLLSEKDK